MIHLVRHGEAASDEGMDPGLSPAGRLQVHRLAAVLAGCAVERVLHGPRRRTTETALLLAELLGGVSSEASNQLDDRTAVPAAAHRADYPAHAWDWLDAVLDAERDIDGVAMTGAWGELWAAHASSQVVLVTHSFVVAWFVRDALSAQPAAWMRLMVQNASLTSIDTGRHGEPVLDVFNQRPMRTPSSLTGHPSVGSLVVRDGDV